MSNLTKLETQQVQAWTDQEVMALKDQIARDANDTEMRLFLYTATQRGLNPLLKQIYCIHRGGRMTIQTSIDGYRLIANRTGKLTGIKRGVKYDNAGNITHGWAEVFRSDWQHSAYEEASFKEYNQGQGNWTKMPETMIKKVAEAAALRMAFPEDLSGLYTHDEMDQADRNEPVSQREVTDAAARIDSEVEKEKTKKEILAIIEQVKLLCEKNEIPLEGEDFEWISGFKGIKVLTSLKKAEDCLGNIIQHIEAKKINPEGQNHFDLSTAVNY